MESLFVTAELGSAGWSDDSDFDLSSCSESSDSEEDEEENRLCNTMVLVGPPGVGKTSTVYALAAELGYKVSKSTSQTTTHICCRFQTD